MNKLTIFAAALASFPAAAIAANAPQISVETDDLDLAVAADQARLDTRVENAIRRACEAGSRSLSDRRAERECRDTLRDAATVEVRLAIAAAREDRFAALDVDPDA